MSFGNFGSKPMKTPKAPKAPGKKPFSSRTVIGVVCIVLALLITFGVAPLTAILLLSMQEDPNSVLLSLRKKLDELYAKEMQPI